MYVVKVYEEDSGGFYKAKSYDEAKKVVDSILGTGLYSPSASNI